jgi:hypothetical protein
MSHDNPFYNTDAPAQLAEHFSYIAGLAVVRNRRPEQKRRLALTGSSGLGNGVRVSAEAPMIFMLGWLADGPAG